MSLPRLPCSFCGRPQPPSGHDPCIADLPGVLFACCGHGGLQGFNGSKQWSVPYVVETGRPILYGDPALDRIRELGGDPPNWDSERVLAVSEITADQLAHWCRPEGHAA